MLDAYGYNCTRAITVFFDEKKNISNRLNCPVSALVRRTRVHLKCLQFKRSVHKISITRETGKTNNFF